MLDHTSILICQTDYRQQQLDTNTSSYGDLYALGALVMFRSNLIEAKKAIHITLVSIASNGDGRSGFLHVDV